MMKKSLLVVFLITGIISSYAGKWIEINSSSPSPASTVLVSSNQQSTVVRFTLDGYALNKVNTPRGDAFTLYVDEAFRMLQKGDPDLLKLSASLIIPDNGDVEVHVISKKYTDYTNIDIAPSKGNFTRDILPSSVAYTYGKAYTTNAFFPGKLAEVQEPYIFRDYRGAAVWVYPFQYNAVTRTLRVIHEMVVEVKLSSGKSGSINTWMKPAKINREFNNIYSTHFLNYSQPKYTAIDEHGSMLIISYGSYMGEMLDFVSWKNTIGIPTEIVNVSTIGNAAAIKTYISTYYAANNLAFVLLVGDAAQIPTQTVTAGHSDNSYGYITGNDSYPEVFVGRFSGESTADIQTQVMRTVMYEQSPLMNSSCFNRSIGIASSQGPGDDNEMDYQHVRNMQTDLLNFTYSYNGEFFDGSQGGNDLAGNPSASSVGTGIDAGAGIILYTGHGSTTSWSTSGFSNSNINALQNFGMLPFIWSVACVNGNFVNNTCFAETWMRSRSSDIPRGAIGTLMSTINQSWDPPMEGQDEMVDILVESYTNNIKRTFAGLSINGCMKMNDTYGNSGYSMTDTWNLFGDPSLMVRTDTPQVLTVIYSPAIMLGAAQFQVACLTDDALVTLSKGGQIMSSELVVSGVANFTFSPLSTLDSITVAVTAFNAVPYIGTLQVIPASGPYVLYNNAIVNDVNGNNNGLPEFGETVLLDVSLANMGIDTARQVSAVLNTNDTYVNLIVDSSFWGNILAGDTQVLNGAFTLGLANDIPDDHDVNFTIDINDTSGNTWSSIFNITAYAPELVINDFSINDALTGNGNGVLDPGETADVVFSSANTGHCDALSTMARLLTSNPLVSIQNDTFMFNNLAAGTTGQAVFTITLDASVSMGSGIDLVYILESGAYNVQKVYMLTVGEVLEDFETGNFTKFNWAFDGTTNWTVTAQNPYMGTYCSKSGVIPNNAYSELSITLNVLTDDTISFFRKISSEQNYDYLQFYIDNDKKDEWSGTVSWGKESFAVSAGQHTFKWKYEKDWYVSAGSDCAWLDDIQFPPVLVPGSALTVGAIAYSNTICEGESTQLLAVVSGGSGNYTYIWSPGASLSSTSVSNPMATPLANTTYSVTVNDGIDTLIATVIVTVNPLPQTPVINQAGNQLSSSANIGNQWYNDFGAITGAMGQSFTPTANGNYYVIVTNSFGCNSLPSNSINFTITGIGMLSPDNSIFIFPNPFGTSFYVKIYIEVSQSVKLALYNAIGQQMLTDVYELVSGSVNTITISTEGMHDGIYYLQVNLDEGTITRKIVKKAY